MMANNLFFTMLGLLITTLLNFAVIEPAPLGSRITSLPGFEGEFPSKHYSGYVTVDENNAKHLFYYFVESEGKPSEDPVVLWLNGGPGCSSLSGFADEHGPFDFEALSGPFTSKGSKAKPYMPKLTLNQYSWSKVSNMLYVDSPVGVGLSYSLNTSDYKTGDIKTASDMHKFLLKWFALFPEFLGNRFFIAGESYAGVYVPTLASEIMKGLDSGVQPLINLKGYLIGNGVIGNDSDGKSPFTYAYKMGFITDDLYQEFVKLCPRSIHEPKCNEVITKFNKMTNGLNQFHVTGPCYSVEYDPEFECSNCLEGDGSDVLQRMLPRSTRRLRRLKLPRSTQKGISTLNTTSVEVASGLSTMCDNDLTSYFWFNDAAVRKAIHAADVSVADKWEVCTNRVKYNSDAGGMIKYHKRLTSLGLQVLIYSGDSDMVVPYIESESWTRSLGYKIIDEWRPWISNEQIAGFTIGYDNNLTLLTVKGAGHMVPGSKPREALDFYSRWLAGKKV